MAQQKEKFETPLNEDAEKSYIGCVLIDGNEVLKQTRHIVGADDFFDRHISLIFKACVYLYDSGIEPDLLTITDRLKSTKDLDTVGGSATLASYTDHVPTTGHAVHYAKLVAKYATLRRILTAARDIGQMSQDSDLDLDELLVKAETRLKGVTRDSKLQQDRLEIVDLQDYMTQAREHREPEGTIKGLSTGLQKIDKMTQGFVPGELMIISGQTSHGKTQLSNNIMLSVAKNNHKVMFVTMEMTKLETADRFNSLTKDQDIGHGKIYLNMRSDLAYTDVTRMIERAKEMGCDLVVIDHLHYFSRSIENATQEVSKIVKEFKSAAVQYDVPIILICHVRKMAPKKHPTLEDLRDSSLIAQDADMVLIVWRDEAPGAQNPLEVEVTLWKNRNRQKKHRRDFLYADGLTLKEDDPRPVDQREAQRQAANTARMLGEKDDDVTVADLEAFGEADLDIPDF